ncbi:MAG: hypothetical protein IJA48_08355 [Oscillospiraceae bacterium]|nr:hypothetical protein [Oscillospiraceae bacterium]
MFTKAKTTFLSKDMQPTWEFLVKRERRLRRNKLLCRIIQPVGGLIFLFNLLLATCNAVLFFLGDTFAEFFAAVPVLPGLVEGFPRGSSGQVLGVFLWFAYLIPLAVCGLIFGVLLLLDFLKYKDVKEPLQGTEAECAKALVNKAETVYDLRKKIPTWSVYLETGIITALTAVPLVIGLIRVAGEGTGAVLQIALYCLALIVVLFVFFWVYALLFKAFSLLNSLYYLSGDEWDYYQLYQRLDAYWESVDEEEFSRREEKLRRQREEKARRRRRKPSEENQ